MPFLTYHLAHLSCLAFPFWPSPGTCLRAWQLALVRQVSPGAAVGCVGSQGQPHLPKGLSALQESSRVEAAFVSSFFMPSSKLSLPPNS